MGGGGSLEAPGAEGGGWYPSARILKVGTNLCYMLCVWIEQSADDSTPKPTQSPKLTGEPLGGAQNLVELPGIRHGAYVHSTQQTVCIMYSLIPHPSTHPSFFPIHATHQKPNHQKQLIAACSEDGSVSIWEEQGNE